MRRSGRLAGREQGMTLVLALFVITLLTILIVGLLVQSQSSQKGAHLHVEALRARQLGESAMSLATSRIQEATRTQPGDAWASQPGAIRVYGSDGLLKKVHKLYSASTAIATSGTGVDADLPPTNWAGLSNLYVDLNSPISVGTELRFPIVDPRLYTSGTTDPAGFSYSGTAANGSAVAGTVMPGGNPDNQRVPMPVRWLYVLSNGEIVAPVEGVDGTVSVPGAGPNAEIIGRVAFWTDDETSKVNINTAAGGAYWDTPRNCSSYERQLSLSQPVQGEFQRYPGHPATVDLRAVFPWITDLNTLYQFVPKIRGGGSNGGTVETSASTKPPAITPDTDRLFPSSGEAKYKPNRTEYANDAGFGGPFSERIERGDFLLTSSSRAPELNLFGRPRIAIWPLDANASNRSPLDKLIAMCSTIRDSEGQNKAYYFQREDATSPTHDYEEIERNQELLSYLQTATSKAVPGFGGSFSTKYTVPVRNQILTEIFDYVRGATNLKDPLGKKYADPDPLAALEPGEGQVVPIRIESWGTKGFGRFLTVGEAFFWFTLQNNPSSPPPTGQVQTQAIFALNFVGQAVGYSEYSPDITVKIDGLNQLELNNVNMGFPSTGTVYLGQMKDVPTSNIEDFRGLVNKKVFSQDGGINSFPFYSNVLNVPDTNMTMSGPSGAVITISVSIYAGNGVDPEKRIQTIEMSVPNARIPKFSGASPVTWGTGASGDRFYHNGQDRNQYLLKQDRTRSLVSLSGDHRLTAAARDLSSTAGFFIPNQGETGANAGTWMGLTPHANSLLITLARRTNPDTIGYNSTGALDANAHSFYTDSSISRPYVGTHVRGKPANVVAWDWDTGMSDRGDGAHINKPDEGSLGKTGSNNNGYFGGSEAWAPTLDATMFLPNRQVPSAGMFGSLPTGIDPANPANSKAWQTLHLRPDPVNHPGNNAPRDHLLLDLFWMPVVEPYAISEPFSTAGKINMNSRLAPFSHITRDTGLHAALRNERLLAMDPLRMEEYKKYDKTEVAERAYLNVPETLKGFRARFDTGEIFKSPTEISSLYLVPQGQSLTSMLSFWQKNSYTGDNVREKPYANLLAKLTTKSNTYSIHVIAQALKKGTTPGSDPTIFGQSADKVTGEWRGTFLMERFLDSNASDLPDFAGPASVADWTDPLYNADHHYQTRILQVKEWR